MRALSCEFDWFSSYISGELLHAGVTQTCALRVRTFVEEGGHGGREARSGGGSEQEHGKHGGAVHADQVQTLKIKMFGPTAIACVARNV